MYVWLCVKYLAQLTARYALENPMVQCLKCLESVEWYHQTSLFISGLLGCEISLPKFSDSPYNAAETCAKLYLKIKHFTLQICCIIHPQYCYHRINTAGHASLHVQRMSNRTANHNQNCCTVVSYSMQLQPLAGCVSQQCSHLHDFVKYQLASQLYMQLATKRQNICLFSKR